MNKRVKKKKSLLKDSEYERIKQLILDGLDLYIEQMYIDDSFMSNNETLISSTESDSSE